MTDSPPLASRKLQRRALMLAVAGVALALVAVLWAGAGAVWAGMARVGAGGLALLCLYTLAYQVMLGCAWWLLAPDGRRLLGQFIWARLLRDGVVQALPFTTLAGPVAGARVLSTSGVAVAEAGALAVVDMSLELFAGIAFIAIGGVVALGTLTGANGASLVPVFVTALGLCALGGVGLVFAPGLVLKAVERFGAKVPYGLAGEAAQIRTDIQRLWGRRGPVMAAFLLHLTAWLAGAGWSTLALYLLGAPAPLPKVILLEALILAVRAGSFFVPNAYGVQEGAYGLLGRLFGLPPQAGVALSLMRRARDLTLGVPIVILWQVLEARRLRRAQPPTAV